MRTRAVALLVALAAAAALSGCTPAVAPSTAGIPAQTQAQTQPQTKTQTVPQTTAPTQVADVIGQEWLGYHSDDARTGALPADNALDHLRQEWSTTLTGGVHNQPVAADNRIIVADESNHVSALNVRTGTVLWRVSLGTPLTHVVKYAGCGDLDPLGITSTPVIDDATDVVYVVGEVQTSLGHVHHQLEGINILTGAVVLSENVDPPLSSGESAIHLLQRTSLALANGRVYIGFGGNDGDCGRYHGWVVGVNETGAPAKVSFEVASDGEGGAIWQGGGAPAIDGAGNIYVTTGNANPDPPLGGPDPKRYTESVVKLSPNLAPLASFKDVIAGGDEDLSTGNPVLLPNGNVFSIGKTRVGYVLQQSDLSEVARIPHICGSDPDGGPAYDPTRDEIFVPCRSGGIQQVFLGSAGSSLPAFSGAPHVGARLQGANSAPILIGEKLWALSYLDNSLTEFDVATDTVVQSRSMGATVAHFESPTLAYGLVLVGTYKGVVAFAGSAISSGPHCDPALVAQLGLSCI